MSRGFRIITAEWKRDREHLCCVREAVFIEEQGIPKSLQWDDDDPYAHHVLALDDDGRPIGTARLLPEARIGRMAVLAHWRGHGIGSALLEALLQSAREQGHGEIRLSSQDHAVEFYLKHGFEPRGDAYLEAGIPHVCMQRQL